MKWSTTEDRTKAGVEKVTYQEASRLDISSLMLLEGKVNRDKISAACHVQRETRKA